MRALVLHQKLDLRLEQIPDCKINEPGELVVRMLTAGICGSDVHYYHEGMNGTAIVVKEPFVLGHEGCGIVEEISPEVTTLKKGDMVVMRPARACFNCHFCRRMMFSYCENVRHLGSAARLPHVNGLFADYVTVHESQCLKVENLSAQLGALAEPLAVGYAGVSMLGNIVGKKVAVMGAGPIGCMCIAAAKTLGAALVCAIDIRDEPLKIAAKMGADIICNSAQNPEQLAQWAEHKGYFDEGIEVSGNGKGLIDLMRIVAPFATISQVGVFGKDNAPTDFGPFLNKCLNWKSSFRFYDEFKPAVSALEKGLIDPLPLISEIYPLEQGECALQAAKAERTMKVELVIGNR